MTMDKLDMSTKLTIDNPLDWRSRALLAESEEERLRAENENLTQAIANTWRPEVVALRAEIERLKAYEQMWHEQYASDLVQARAENENLTQSIANTWQPEVSALCAEVKRLQYKNKQYAAMLKIAAPAALAICDADTSHDRG